MVKNGQTYYLITDQVGSVRAVCDASGNIVKEITYDSFGNILTDTNPAITIPLGFAGGLHDRDTGLVHFGFRDYDPDTGRWTAKDPVLLHSGDIDFYDYCSSMPLSTSDTYGLDAQGRVDAALNLVGGDKYATDAYLRRQYREGDFKCSALVADVISAAGDYCPNINGFGFWNPTAGQWATNSVRGWYPVHDPQPGDVVAEYHGTEPGNTGHCGIVIKPGKPTAYVSTKTNRVELGPWGSFGDVVYLRPWGEIGL